MLTRRSLLLSAAATLEAAGDPVARVEVGVIWKGRAGGTTWFHPRACAIPGQPNPLVFMTCQSITGSDYYGPVHWSESRDLGKTWSAPAPVPGMGRIRHPDGVEEGFCDTVPEYHAHTGAVLALAANVYYKDGTLTRPSERRWPVYIVRSHSGAWSERRKLEWDNPGASAIYMTNCSQRVTLPDGDILIPMSYGPLGRADRAVCTTRYAFDGRELKFRAAGNELRLNVKRGLLEPSLARFGGRCYMTIRAEDDHGYVARSDDGLHWEPIKPWCWDDGEPLTLSTTQQRWLPHARALYLVYTRRSPENVNVVRWRSPLYMARVDAGRCTLLRATERIVFPMSGDGVKAPSTVAHLGNFHTNAVTPALSLITVGETIPAMQFRGDTLLARIHWKP